MFNDTILTVFSDKIKCVHGDAAVFNVKVTQKATLGDNSTDSHISKFAATFDAQALQLRTIYPQSTQTVIGNVTFTNIQRTQLKAVLRNVYDADITHSSTSANI